MNRFLIALAALVAASAAHADETLLLQFPDIHDDQIVFTYGGDLWLVDTDGGTARRLTSHPGLELFARFSPDGSQIAFTGQYAGDEQVYIIPSTGGKPVQLTWYPAEGPLPPRWGYDNQVHGWTPDGDAVLFRSLRDARDSSQGQLYRVSADGGLPEALPMPMAGSGTYTDSESQLFYSPLARDFRTWKRYQGGWAQDLWLFDTESGEARRVTDHPRTDRDPMWINGMGYFASDRGDNGRLNLYRVDPDSGETTQLTFHDEWDVRWPATDGSGAIVYQYAGGLRVFDVTEGVDRAITVQVPDDGLFRRTRTERVDDQIGSARLSPTGTRVLFYARGDLFNAPVEDGVTRGLTRSSDAHDREPSWSPDGQQVAWISDAGGEEALWVGASDGQGEAERHLQELATRLYNPLFSPDGDWIAVSDKDGYIHVVSTDGEDTRRVGPDPAWRNRDYTWSPDGRFLAYSLTQPSGMRALYVYDIEDDRARQVSQGLFSESDPAFSPDGKYLYFLGDREFAPQISSREWNFATNRMTGVLGYTLADDGTSPFAATDDAEPGIVDNDDDEDDDNGKDKDEDSPVRTVIDFDGLADRVFSVPGEATNFAGLWAVDGALLAIETAPFYYGRGPQTQPVLKKFDIEEQEWSTVSEGLAGLDVSADGKKILIRRGSEYTVRGIESNGGDPITVDTSGLVAEIDPVAEWHTAFDEVWRRFRDFFYVENMHGYDWEALRDQYRPLLQHVGHRVDLNDVMGQMIAELNVSHAYVSGGDTGLPDRPSVALVGARFALDDDSGRYRIESILQGHNDDPVYRAPLTEAGLDVSEGDFVLAINGRPLERDDNPYKLLTGVRSDVVALTIADNAAGRNRREVLIRPIDDEQPLHYLAWVTGNLAQVEEASDGRLGYLHLPDMGPSGIREFIKWYYGQIDRDGLVIDVRANGGGNVSQMIIERLARKPLALGYSRTMPQASNYPYQAFRGHLVTLLNENSASDGDIFPYQFRNAGLGPLIGTKSWGGVVGITNHGPLVDGGSVNVPEFGFLNTEGEYVVEGEGVAPDIEIDNDTASVIAGRDPQLERAIEVLLEKVESDPPAAPERPEPPVKTP